MSLSTTVLQDRTGALGAAVGSLAGLPPSVTAAYLVCRLLVPIALIITAAHGATPNQRIALVRSYLLSATSPPPEKR